MDRIDADEFIEWMAYYSLEPFGEERADIRNALLCQCVTAPHVKRKMKLSEFIPQFDRPPQQDWRVLQAYFIGLANRKKHGK